MFKGCYCFPRTYEGIIRHTLKTGHDIFVVINNKVRGEKLND